MRPAVMNLPQLLLQTRFIIFFYTSVSVEVLILTVKIKNYKKWRIYSQWVPPHGSAVCTQVHCIRRLFGAVYFASFIVFFLKQVGVNSLAIVVSPTARRAPPPHLLCKTGGSWECYLLHGFTTLSTSPSAMLHKWHKIYSTFILDTSL